MASRKGKHEVTARLQGYFAIRPRLLLFLILRRALSTGHSISRLFVMSFVKLSIFGTSFEVTTRYVDLQPVGMGTSFISAAASSTPNTILQVLSALSGMLSSVPLVSVVMADWMHRYRSPAPPKTSSPAPALRSRRS